jgi:integrase
MARESDKLTELVVRNIKAKEKSFKLADGKGLYLDIKPNGSKYWRLKYRYLGKEKLRALGVYPEVSLKAARAKAYEARQMLQGGVDPGVERKQARLLSVEKTGAHFRAMAEEWYELNKDKWSESSQKRNGWLLKNNLYPWLGDIPISDITVPILLAALKKTESKGTVETAHRAKQVASQVFRYAIASGRLDRDITTDLRGALKAPKKTHMATLTEPKDVARLLVAIDGYQGSEVVKAALKLSPLLFCRPGELRQLEWSEISFEETKIEIPVHKMKTREQPHIIPLSSQALSELEGLHRFTGRGRYVFPSARGGSRPLSDNGVRTALRSLGYSNEEITPHGFRAMARTMLDEILGYRVDWIEHQLAHAVKDPNGRAYNRTAHLEGRMQMMQGWADYLDFLREAAKSGDVLRPNFGR